MEISSELADTSEPLTPEEAPIEPIPVDTPESPAANKKPANVRLRAVYIYGGFASVVAVVIGIVGLLPRLFTSIFQEAFIPVVNNKDWTPVERVGIFDGVTIVLVPAGCFDMGSVDGSNDEEPIETQCFDQPFGIDKYEVTNKHYDSIQCEQASSEPDQPRTCVSLMLAITVRRMVPPAHRSRMGIRRVAISWSGPVSFMLTILTISPMVVKEIQVIERMLSASYVAVRFAMRCPTCVPPIEATIVPSATSKTSVSAVSALPNSSDIVCSDHDSLFSDL